MCAKKNSMPKSNMASVNVCQTWHTILAHFALTCHARELAKLHQTKMFYCPTTV